MISRRQAVLVAASCAFMLLVVWAVAELAIASPLLMAHDSLLLMTLEVTAEGRASLGLGLGLLCALVPALEARLGPRARALTTLALPVIILGLFANARYVHGLRVEPWAAAVDGALAYSRALAEEPARTARALLVLSAPFAGQLWLRARRGAVVMPLVIILAIIDRQLDRADAVLVLVAFACSAALWAVEALSPGRRRPAARGPGRRPVRARRRAASR